MLPAILLQVAVIATTITGRVVTVADGDTLTLLTADKRQVRVRLAEIDAPEKAQAYGQRAKQALSAMVFGRDVRIAVQTTDRYGRTVGRVYVGDVDVNAALVRAGMAWAYRQYLRDRSLVQLEAQARADKVGLWADASPTPPGEYRRSKRRGRGGAKATEPQQPRDSGSERTVTCGSKRYCREMSSCDEARAYLEKCGVRTLDGDRDGVPCEALCAAH